MILEYRVIDNKYYNLKELLKVYFQISDNLITKLKKNKQILLNSEFTYLDHILSINDIVKINLDFDETSDNIVPNGNIPLNIIYEDESMIIINKQPNTPIHPSINHFDDSLSNAIQFYFNENNIKRKIRPVNRLDKDTSGIVIFAKNEYVQELLIRQMKSNKFNKEYIAILVGHLKEKSGTIDAPISRKSESIIEREINDSGAKSITHYELIKNFENNKTLLSLVKFRLETGRTHQIRVHSKYIGHPILGDSLYGKSSNLILRQALHANRISFIHPISREIIEFEAPIPQDINNIIK